MNKFRQEHLNQQCFKDFLRVFLDSGADIRVGMQEWWEIVFGKVHWYDKLFVLSEMAVPFCDNTCMCGECEPLFCQSLDPNIAAVVIPCPSIHIFSCNLEGKGNVLALLLECPYLVLADVVFYIDKMAVQNHGDVSQA